MGLELYVWGPAFSLPSVDPQCLAAIAYLTEAVPRGKWVLIASSDATLSPTKGLPVLRDGLTIIGGFQSIIDHLRQISDGQWDLDRHFHSPQDRADITALLITRANNRFSSFIHTCGQPLIDLSLYVSSENYTTTTRPSYTRILQWPTQYFIPPSHRALAKTRTEHLSLSSLDLDNLDEEERSRRKVADLIPEALRTSSRQSVTGLVKQSQSTARFRLDALLDAFCQPLTQLLGGKRFLLSHESMSSLDCLTLAYLALAYKPEVPQAWLTQGMRARYRGLCEWVEESLADQFGGPVAVEDALPRSNPDHTATSKGKPQSALPWRVPEHRGVASAGSAVFSNVTNSLPYCKSTTLTPQSDDEFHSTNIPAHSFTSTFIPPLLAGAGAIATTAAYLLYANLNQEPKKRRLSEMGEAGAMLAGMDFGHYESSMRDRIPPADGRVPVGLEMDVAVEKGF